MLRSSGSPPLNPSSCHPQWARHAAAAYSRTATITTTSDSGRGGNPDSSLVIIIFIILILLALFRFITILLPAAEHALSILNMPC